MTPRQYELLQFIKRYVAEHDYPPTYREMSRAIGAVSPSAAYRLVEVLIADGHLAPTRSYRGGRKPPRAFKVRTAPAARVIIRVRGHEYLGAAQTGDVEVVVEEVKDGP